MGQSGSSSQPCRPGLNPVQGRKGADLIDQLSFIFGGTLDHMLKVESKHPLQLLLSSQSCQNPFNWLPASRLFFAFWGSNLLD